MNLKQAEIILEKITRLYKSMKLDERNIDVFEQDLMLSYIRQMHEAFSPDKPISKRIKPDLPPEEDIIIPIPIAKEKPIKTPENKPTPVPKPKETEAPKTIERPKIAEIPKSKEVPQEEAPKSTEPAKPVVNPPVYKPQSTNPQTGLSAAEQSALFEVKQATELSEKLSQAPVRDLTKAMGLNEKIFTINELFDGDSKAFDETVKKLNTFGSFEAAREYLSSGVAHTFKWTDGKKKKKAINFIQLVKRRYN